MNQLNELNKASRRRRIIAFLIDHLIFSFLMVSSMFLVLGVDFFDKNYDMNSLMTNMLLVMMLWFIFYFSKDIYHGISPGKWFAGIMVLNESNGECPSIVKLFIRNLFVIIWPIEFLVLIFNKEKKRIGDTVAKTVVVDHPNPSKVLYRIITLLAVFILSYFLVNLFADASVKASQAYKTSVAYIESNDQLQEELGEILSCDHSSDSEISVVNGYGNASIVISIKGSKSDTELTFYLVKEPEGAWQIIDVRK